MLRLPAWPFVHRSALRRRCRTAPVHADITWFALTSPRGLETMPFMRKSTGLTVVLALTLLASPATAADPALPPSNPLPFEYSEGQAVPRREVRDPCIIREGDRYYPVFTMWPFRGREEKHLAEPDGGGSPGIALYSSPDLKAWKFKNWLVKSSALQPGCALGSPKKLKVLLFFSGAPNIPSWPSATWFSSGTTAPARTSSTSGVTA